MIFRAFFDWLRALFWSTQLDVACIGLQNAGKTSLVNVLTDNAFSESMIPTVGFNLRKVQKGNVTIKMWGQPRFRSIWERYCRGVNAIVWVLDSADRDTFATARSELHALLEKAELRGIPLLVLANKNDISDHASVDEVIKALALATITNREVSCYSISAKSSRNIDITVACSLLTWLTRRGAPILISFRHSAAMLPFTSGAAPAQSIRIPTFTSPTAQHKTAVPVTREEARAARIKQPNSANQWTSLSALANAGPSSLAHLLGRRDEPTPSTSTTEPAEALPEPTKKPKRRSTVLPRKRTSLKASLPAPEPVQASPPVPTSSAAPAPTASTNAAAAPRAAEGPVDPPRRLSGTSAAPSLAGKAYRRPSDPESSVTSTATASTAAAPPTQGTKRRRSSIKAKAQEEAKRPQKEDKGKGKGKAAEPDDPPAPESLQVRRRKSSRAAEATGQDEAPVPTTKKARRSSTRASAAAAVPDVGLSGVARNPGKGKDAAPRPSTLESDAEVEREQPAASEADTRPSPPPQAAPPPAKRRRSSADRAPALAAREESSASAEKGEGKKRRQPKSTATDAAVVPAKKRRTSAASTSSSTSAPVSPPRARLSRRKRPTPPSPPTDDGQSDVQDDPVAKKAIRIATERLKGNKGKLNVLDVVAGGSKRLLERLQLNTKDARTLKLLKRFSAKVQGPLLERSALVSTFTSTSTSLSSARQRAKKLRQQLLEVQQARAVTRRELVAKETELLQAEKENEWEYLGEPIPASVASRGIS
ncbi:hypothetical protein Rhopal_007168-T1 [Rhodotorula paludigena]|uniref:Uncharacterized protein n=1 Tax=Rhodotorula paludigena TaxID=86838 RepID=A0AAV5GVU7_9BASI|nr:hypothetical protein Rhopal_007168-T1 [Rhodotorula paludigena]